MTFPVAKDLRGERVRLPPARGIGARLRAVWRRVCRRTRTGMEAFLASAVPPPGMIFPDSGDPSVQFPTLSSLVIRYGRPSPAVWDETGPPGIPPPGRP
jgi:hypothetical protein